MITLHSFTEAYRSYTAGRIPFRLLQDQAAVLFCLCIAINKPAIPDALAVTGEHIDWLLLQPEADLRYADFLGGNVHVCEREDDLAQIVGIDTEWADEHGGSWPNVTELAMAWDSCNYLPEESGDSQWVQFLLCWNDAGGSVYFVPRHLWTAARVTEHITLSNQFWQGNQ